MESMNSALLSKWWWRFFNEPHIPWCKIIRSLYYSKRRPLHEGRTFAPYSQWWRCVVRCRDVFKCGLSFEPGDGRNIRLWSDIWTEETPLSTLFPDIYECIVHKDAHVSNCWNANGWRWRFITRGFRGSHLAQGRSQLASLKDLLHRTHLCNRPDLPQWRWTANQLFTVKSVYQLLNSGGIRDRMNQYFWRLKIPTKIKIFTWLLLRKRLLSADRLLTRGLDVDQHCVFCAAPSETCDHLFYTCVFVRYILFSAESLDISPVPLGDVRNLWLKVSETPNAAARARGLALLTAIWWVVWTDRNSSIFQGTSPDAARAIKRVKLLISDWTLIH